MIKKRICMFFIVVCCFILQTTVLKAFELGAVAPNLLLIITAAFGFVGGRKDGMFIGVFCGLFADIFYGQLFGYYTLLYTLIGYANGFFRKIFYDDDIKLPLILIATSDFLYGNIVCIFMFIMRSRFNYFYYLKSIIFPELIYTILVTLVFYQLILQINKKLESEEQRSASKFV